MKNLRELRESKGFKQNFIAENLGLSRQALSRKESRISPVTLPEIDMLARIYGVEEEEIIRLSRVK